MAFARATVMRDEHFRWFRRPGAGRDPFVRGPVDLWAPAFAGATVMRDERFRWFRRPGAGRDPFLSSRRKVTPPPCPLHVAFGTLPLDTERTP